MAKYWLGLVFLALFGADCAGISLPPTATTTPLPVEVVVSFDSTAMPVLAPAASLTAVPSRTATLPSEATPTATAVLISPTVSPPSAAAAAAPQVVFSPTATLSALPAEVPAPDVAAAEQHTIDLINAQRAAAGLPPLARDETLMRIARTRVADMIARNYTGHFDPVTGEGLGKSMMHAAGYTTNFMAENWYGHAQGPLAAADVAMAWFMTDPPHADNILSPHFVGVGVGIAFNGQQWLLVQDFAGQ
jgi:uncharacterized protein YkwD